MNKLKEIRERHGGDQTNIDRGVLRNTDEHQDRAYLLKRINELEENLLLTHIDWDKRGKRIKKLESQLDAVRNEMDNPNMTPMSVIRILDKALRENDG